MNTRVLQSPAQAGYAESPMAELLARPMNFNPDAYHAMQARDEVLIRDQVLRGSADKSFVYQFSIGGKPVTGISVVGARELASKYGGIKARIVATVEKRGALFIFRTFTPLTIDTRQLHDLAEDEDFYECVMEISDLKSGNSIEVRKKEMRRERTRDGKMFERPHYDVIAESKAYRNGVLAILPQNVINDFERKCLQAGNVSNEKTIDQLRDGAMTFATKQGISLDRQGLAALTYAELYGLSHTAKDLGAFREACESMGLVRSQQQAEPTKRQARGAAKEAPQDAPPADPDDAALREGEQRKTATPHIEPVELLARIEAAKNYETLGECGDLIGSLPNKEWRDKAVAAYQTRMAQLDGEA